MEVGEEPSKTGDRDAPVEAGSINTVPADGAPVERMPPGSGPIARVPVATTAATAGPDTASAVPPPAVTGRTPRWVWLWVLPAVVILLLYLARRVLGPFIIAGILAYIFSMVIDRLQERLRWPRALIVSLLYVIVLGAIGAGLFFGAEALFKQSTDLAVQGPKIVADVLQQIMGNNTITLGGEKLGAAQLGQHIADVAATYMGGGEFVHLASVVIERLLDTLLVILVSFYLLLDGKRIGASLLRFVPAGSRARTGYVAARIHGVLGAYLRGQLYLILIMSAASFIVLAFIFQVPFALPLALLTGFLEILPLLGPAIATVVAASVALSGPGAGAALGVVIAYLILREVEDQVVMPVVVGRIVELHPVVTIFAVLAGGAMAGVLGMLLAVPVAAASKVILDFLYPVSPEEAMDAARPGIKHAEADIKKET